MTGDSAAYASLCSWDGNEVQTAALPCGEAGLFLMVIRFDRWSPVFLKNSL